MELNKSSTRDKNGKCISRQQLLYDHSTNEQNCKKYHLQSKVHKDMLNSMLTKTIQSKLYKDGDFNVKTNLQQTQVNSDIAQMKSHETSKANAVRNVAVNTDIDNCTRSQSGLETKDVVLSQDTSLLMKLGLVRLFQFSDASDRAGNEKKDPEKSEKMDQNLTAQDLQLHKKRFSKSDENNSFSGEEKKVDVVDNNMNTQHVAQEKTNDLVKVDALEKECNNWFTDAKGNETLLNMESMVCKKNLMNKHVMDVSQNSKKLRFSNTANIFNIEAQVNNNTTKLDNIFQNMKEIERCVSKVHNTVELNIIKVENGETESKCFNLGSEKSEVEVRVIQQAPASQLELLDQKKDESEQVTSSLVFASGNNCSGRQCGSKTGESKGGEGASGQQDSTGNQGGGAGGDGEAWQSQGGSGGSGSGAGGGRDGDGWQPPDKLDPPDAEDKDVISEKGLNDVDKGGMGSIQSELSLNISGEASLGSSSGGSTKATTGGRCISGELSDEDNNSMMLRQLTLEPGGKCGHPDPGEELGLPDLREKCGPLKPGGIVVPPEPGGSSSITEDGDADERPPDRSIHCGVPPDSVEIVLTMFDPSQNFSGPVILELKRLRHPMFTEVNKCLRHCFDKSYLATAFTCGMCLSLSAMIRHMGRCTSQRSRCKACDHISNILKLHVRRCMLRERQSVNPYAHGTDSGSIVTSFISSILTSVPLSCPIEFCVKLRSKLHGQRGGMQRAPLEMLWGKQDLWQRMKHMIAYIYDIDLEYEVEVPAGEDLLDSISLSLPMASVQPSRTLKKKMIQKFIQSQKRVIKAKPPVPPKPKLQKVPPKVPPRPKPISILGRPSGKKEETKQQEVLETHVVPEVVGRVATSPFRRVLGTLRDSDIPEDLYGAGSLPEQPIVRGPAVGATIAGAEGGQAAPFLSRGYATTVEAPEMLPPQAGEGQVDYGTVEDLHSFINRLQEMRDQYEMGMINMKNVHEGIILEHMQHCLSVVEGRYAEGDSLEWISIVHLGSGVTGRCWLILDEQTHFQACVKRVDLLKFDKREVEVWSALDHHQVADLYGTIVHEREVLMFAEFIDGGTLAEVIAKHAEDRSLSGEIGSDGVKGIDVQNSLFLYQQMLAVLNYFMQPDVQVLHEDIKADNVMLRAETSELVLVDLGLARRLPETKSVPGGESPSGAQTHWSPEKAASEGHSFPADWWAATCVLLECLTTEPPWLERFRHATMLHFIIKMHSPPMEDVPAQLDPVVRDIIKEGFTVDPNCRPCPMEQAKHPAFAKYGIQYMLEDEDTEMEVVVMSVGAEYSSSGSSTVTPQPSIPSDPAHQPSPEPPNTALLRKAHSERTNKMRQQNVELQMSSKEGTHDQTEGCHSEGSKPDILAPVISSQQVSPEHTSSSTQESSGPGSSGGQVMPRLSWLLNDTPPSGDQYHNTGARPKVLPKPQLPPTVPDNQHASNVGSSNTAKSVEEEQALLIKEIMQKVAGEEDVVKNEQLLRELSTISSTGDGDSGSNHSGTSSQYGDISLLIHPEPMPLTAAEGTLIQFRKVNEECICNVRVKKLNQLWKDIILRASAKIHEHYQIFSVFGDIHLQQNVEPSNPVGRGASSRNVFVVDCNIVRNWHWKCVRKRIEYTDEAAHLLMNWDNVTG